MNVRDPTNPPPAGRPGLGTAVVETIAAVATAPGAGGIAVVRVSGPAAFAIAAALFRRPDRTPGRNSTTLTLEDITGRAGRTSYGHWFEPEHGDDGECGVVHDLRGCGEGGIRIARSRSEKLHGQLIERER